MFANGFANEPRDTPGAEHQELQCCGASLPLGPLKRYQAAQARRREQAGYRLCVLRQFTRGWSRQRADS